MDLNYSPDEQAFRAEVRDFIATHLPDDIRHKVANRLHLEKSDYVRWQQILHGQGWIAPGWPHEHGGTGWDLTRRFIFEEELDLAPTPRIMPFGLKMVGPVIYTFGSPEQKARFLPRILASEDWWCQGYSEPGSGSDLASLSTKAVRDGDHYVVNGTKTWTTLAQYADWIFCLVRTDPAAKAQEGISFLLIDMTSPGISVTPIVTMEGGHEVNSVFFDDVRVPAANRVGEENKGWTYAKFLLGHERSNIAGVASSKRWLQRLKEIAVAESDGAGGRLWHDETFRRKVVDVEVQLAALEYTELRMTFGNKGRPPGPETSLLKIRGTDIQQALTELTMEAMGYYALPFEADALKAGWNEEPIGPDYAAPAAPIYFNWRKSSIYGGSNEIQRGIIAKMVLGL